MDIFLLLQIAMVCVSSVLSSKGSKCTALGCAVSSACSLAVVGTLLSGTMLKAVGGTWTISMWFPPKSLYQQGGLHIVWVDAR